MKIASLAIQAELDRVLSSRCFRSRKTAQRFLTYVVKQTLKGNGTTINQLSIALEGLGKDADFDPSSNPLIRVQAGRLRKQLEDYYLTEGKENLYRINLPTGSYLPEFIHRDEHERLNITTQTKSPGTSQGPGLVCVPRIFTSDETSGWPIITRLARDYVIDLTQFNFCQIIFADENQSQSKTWPDAAWNEYETDFALLFDLYDGEDGYNLKCSLAHSQTRQIVWAENYILGKGYPDQQSLKQIFKRIADDTVSFEQGHAHNFWARYLLDSGNPVLPQHQVMVALRKRVWDLTPKTLHDARKVCEQRLAKYPQDVQALIVYADLCRTEFLVKFGEFDQLFDEWKKISDKLIHLAPRNSHSHLFYAAIHLIEEQFESCNESLAQALSLNPLDTHLAAVAGLAYIAIDDWDTGIDLVRDSTSLSPTYPNWYNIPLALNYYRQEEYLKAMKAAQKVRDTTFWGPTLRAVLFRRNGFDQQSDLEIDKLHSDYTGFSFDTPGYLDSFTTKTNQIMAELWSELTNTPENGS